MNEAVLDNKVEYHLEFKKGRKSVFLNHLLNLTHLYILLSLVYFIIERIMLAIQVMSVKAVRSMLKISQF